MTEQFIPNGIEQSSKSSHVEGHEAQKLEGKNLYDQAFGNLNEIFDHLSKQNKVFYNDARDYSYAEGQMTIKRFALVRHYATRGRPFFLVLEKPTETGQFERETFTILDDGKFGYEKSINPAAWRINAPWKGQTLESGGFSRDSELPITEDRIKAQELLSKLAQAKAEVLSFKGPN